MLRHGTLAEAAALQGRSPSHPRGKDTQGSSIEGHAALGHTHAALAQSGAGQGYGMMLLPHAPTGGGVAWSGSSPVMGALGCCCPLLLRP